MIHEPGGPEVLKVESRPIPTPRAGEVLIRVKAFGLNRSEMFTEAGPFARRQVPACPGDRGRRAG